MGIGKLITQSKSSLKIKIKFDACISAKNGTLLQHDSNL